jgi:hypothetical protein
LGRGGGGGRAIGLCGHDTTAQGRLKARLLCEPRRVTQCPAFRSNMMCKGRKPGLQSRYCARVTPSALQGRGAHMQP